MAKCRLVLFSQSVAVNGVFTATATAFWHLVICGVPFKTSPAPAAFAAAWVHIKGPLGILDVLGILDILSQSEGYWLQRYAVIR
jgi:hypothetical protein